ncbi:hypothetical protein Nepgr_009856 [Nepenthes gracilis]|uniref:IBB domain-containing protein n=1 Tax=Nepenthes gracilis TaxID=150966 RepID=A0AAD3SC57_NEPGR|nr:hypothetical protein Nepgr_009856 [Nepenthes gracilis]
MRSNLYVLVVGLPFQGPREEPLMLSYAECILILGRYIDRRDFGNAGKTSPNMSLRPSPRTEVRCSHYRVAVDAEEGRRRREDNMVEIQKNSREESLQKKHREGFRTPSISPLLLPPLSSPRRTSQARGQIDRKCIRIPFNRQELCFPVNFSHLSTCYCI